VPRLRLRVKQVMPHFQMKRTLVQNLLNHRRKVQGTQGRWRVCRRLLKVYGNEAPKLLTTVFSLREVPVSLAHTIREEPDAAFSFGSGLAEAMS
jgi:hypothetical protein